MRGLRIVRGRSSRQRSLLTAWPSKSGTAQIPLAGCCRPPPPCVDHETSVTRETFAVFMEPNWDEMMTMPDGMNIEHAQGKEAEKHLPKGVPLLRSRWQGNEQDFGLFTEATIKSYYQ